MEAQPILRKTLLTVAVMVGAWVAFVGTLSILAVVVTSHIVGSNRDANEVEESSEPARRLLPGSLPTPGNAGRGGREKPQPPSSPAPSKESHHHESI
jgi:hypothetical protein